MSKQINFSFLLQSQSPVIATAISAPVLPGEPWHGILFIFLLRCSWFLDSLIYSVFDCTLWLLWLFNIWAWGLEVQIVKLQCRLEYCGANLAAAALTRPYKETINAVVGRHDVMWHHGHTYTLTDSGSLLRQGSMKEGRERSWISDRGT